MMAPRPAKPCRFCDSVRFAHVPALIVLVPFLSAAQPERKFPARRPGRSGDALVCLGCGHIEHFMQATDTLLAQEGVMEVLVEGVGPYR